MPKSQEELTIIYTVYVTVNKEGWAEEYGLDNNDEVLADVMASYFQPAALDEMEIAARKLTGYDPDDVKVKVRSK